MKFSCGTVFFQFNKRLEFDVRRGNFNEIAALDLALTTNAVNIDYKNHCMTGISKPVNGSFQNNFANPATG
jgi:iron complex outermembrane receptor protein